MSILREERFLRFVILHHAADEPPEGAIMIHVNEMTELMNDHIVNDLERRHRETIIEGEMLSRAAAAPLRLRFLNVEGFRRDFQLLLIDLYPFPNHLLTAGEVKLLQFKLERFFRKPMRFD